MSMCVCVCARDTISRRPGIHDRENDMSVGLRASPRGCGTEYVCEYVCEPVPKPPGRGCRSRIVCVTVLRKKSKRK